MSKSENCEKCGRPLGSSSIRDRNPKFQEFQVRLEDTDFRALGPSKKAEAMGCDPATIWRWEKDLEADGTMAGIIERSRALYRLKFGPQVDAALIKGAIKGKEGCMELYYQKYEGWSPKNILSVDRETSPFDGMTLPQMRAEMIRTTIKNPVYPGLHPSLLSCGLKLLDREEREAVLQAIDEAWPGSVVLPMVETQVAEAKALPAPEQGGHQ